ncbi:MAG: 50S ribosomal protein L20 [Acidobacteria bacterium]|nr:MAG: 50S ribosomal protein L20 [Acidobacteriota bacterium]
MARVKRGNRRLQRRKKYLRMAKGYWGAKGRLHRYAKEAVERALTFSYIGRKRKKRDFRRLWIIRINAAARLNGLNYSQFMHGLKLADVRLNRKMLADLAVNDEAAFAELANMAKEALKTHQAA